MIDDPPETSERDAAFVRRFLIGGALIGLAALVLMLADLLLLIVGAIIIAAVLRAAALLICRVLPLSERWAVMAVVLLGTVILGAAGWLFGPEITAQVSALLATLPAAAAKLSAQIEATEWARSSLRTWKKRGSTPPASPRKSRSLRWASQA